MPASPRPARVQGRAAARSCGGRLSAPHRPGRSRSAPAHASTAAAPASRSPTAAASSAPTAATRRPETTVTSPGGQPTQVGAVSNGLLDEPGDQIDIARGTGAHPAHARPADTSGSVAAGPHSRSAELPPPRQAGHRARAGNPTAAPAPSPNGNFIPAITALVYVSFDDRWRQLRDTDLLIDHPTAQVRNQTQLLPTRMNRIAQPREFTGEPLRERLHWPITRAPNTNTMTLSSPNDGKEKHQPNQPAIMPTSVPPAPPRPAETSSVSA